MADLAIYLSAELLKKLNHWHVTMKLLSKLDKDILDILTHLAYRANGNKMLYQTIIHS